MTILILLIILGFVLLIKGADWMVSGASALAKKKNVSDLTIGLTVVAFGTSAPELVVNSIASFQKHSDIILGNVIGSNNINLFVILGITGLIFPIRVQSSTVWKEIPVSFLAALMLLVLGNSFLWQHHVIINRTEGALLFLMFILFLLYVFRQMKKEASRPDITVQNKSNLRIWGLIVIGMAGLVFGGKLVVKNTVEIASALDVSEKVIALTVVALGTSLPELVTSIVAAVKKNTDMAIGNVIGSNVFNIFLILSISSLINPVIFNTAFNIDLLILMGGTGLIFIAMFSGNRKKLDRWEAGIMLVSFIAYNVYLIGNEI